MTNPKSPDALLVADLWWAMLAVGSFVLIAVLAALLVGMATARRGIGRPLQGRPAWTLVLAGGVVAPILAILGLVVSGVYVGRSVASRPPQGALTVEVHGRLWWWEFRYRDPSGRVLAVTANELHLPLGEPVRLLLRSDNVIHSFWVPNLQGKTDLVPGQVNETRIRATEAGIYRGQCAEFCGTQHALMGFLAVVEPAERFAAWLDRQSRPAAEPGDGAPSRGLDVFLSAGCGQCHTIRGTPASGRIGPDLTHLGGRRTLAAATIPNARGHLGGWIADPQHVKPGNGMPPTALEPDELHALLAYLQSLE